MPKVEIQKPSRIQRFNAATQIWEDRGSADYEGPVPKSKIVEKAKRRWEKYHKQRAERFVKINDVAMARTMVFHNFGIDTTYLSPEGLKKYNKIANDKSKKRSFLEELMGYDL